MRDMINHAQVHNLVSCAVLLEGSQKAAAKVFEVSPQYLSDILRGRREITDKIAKHFGLKRCVMFYLDPERKGGIE